MRFHHTYPTIMIVVMLTRAERVGVARFGGERRRRDGPGPAAALRRDRTTRVADGLVRAANRITAALDLIDEIPGLPDVDGMVARLREVVGRFGFESIVLPPSGSDVGPAEGLALLVGWNRPSLERRIAETASNVVRPFRDPAAFAELERRPRRRPAETRGEETSADHWAVMTLTPEGEPLTPAEIAVLRLLGTVVRDRLRELDARRPETGGRPLLSRRERECLEWTAAGKTTWEIAAILDISQNTIDGYIASATRKLGAVNRTQAVAVALRRGLID